MKYNYSVLLDTSFFIRLLNSDDFLHTNAKDYFKYFLENEILLKVSTISIAEYCVKGRIDELPLRNLEIISFDSEHAIKTAEFADVLFTVNRVSEQKIYPRAIIPNDSKLFAQADLDRDIRYFVTSDSRLKRINTKFMFLDITIPYHDLFYSQ